MTNSSSNTEYSITAVHRITGKSRTTIQKHLKNGKLSYTLDNDGAKRISASELIRAYGESCDFSSEGQGSEPALQPHPEMNTLLRTEVNTLQLQLDTLSEERRREREQLQAQVEHLQETLRLAQEGHNRATLLLENRSGEGEWRQAITELENRFSEKNATAIELAKQDALAHFKSQPWWRLIGKQR